MKIELRQEELETLIRRNILESLGVGPGEAVEFSWRNAINDVALVVDVNEWKYQRREPSLSELAAIVGQDRK